ncbi:hypothetical protein HY086_04445 [Candidatus Gottesmanbacteria bacterium]|nr:hypothetical protein [Candidatus Gottesmanbacteria bacterium]
MARYQGQLPPHIVEQLVQFSTSESDAQLNHFTSDALRFGSRDAVDKWLKKGRTIYILTEPQGQILYGILWFGQELMPKEQYTEILNTPEYVFTYAKRLYGTARGRGISYTFMKEAYRDFMRLPQYKNQIGKGFWLTTSADNDRVLAIDRKFGFRVVSKANSDNKVVAVASFFGIMDEILRTDEAERQTELVLA